MKLCVPATDAKGLKSNISGHFGSAPFFILVDTDTGAVEEVRNANEHHSHGRCHPLASLQGRGIGALICSGIGAGALGKLKDAGITAYRAEGATVADLVEGYKAGRLEVMNPESACGRHGCH